MFRVIERKSGATLATYGRSGRNASQFHWVPQIAIDSKGSIYTGEGVDTGKRLQKFIAIAAARWTGLADCVSVRWPG